MGELLRKTIEPGGYGESVVLAPRVPFEVEGYQAKLQVPPEDNRLHLNQEKSSSHPRRQSCILRKSFRGIAMLLGC